MSFKKNYLFALILMCNISFVYSQVFYAGEKPDTAQAHFSNEKVGLYNNILSADWVIKNNKIVTASLYDKTLKRENKFDGKNLFTLFLQNGISVSSDEFELSEPFKIIGIKGVPNAVRYEDRLNGKEIQATFTNAAHHLKLKWSAVLHDSCNYVVQTFELTSTEKNTIEKAVLIKLPLDNITRECGDVDGSPIVRQNMFFALQHPLSKMDTSANFIQLFLEEEKTIDSLQSFTASIAWGITPAGQLRRGFLYYVEHERAAPYHQILHYNSWLDISWFDRKLNDSVCLDRIQMYADSLIVKRHTPMNAFLFDDGWDDNQTLWNFDKGFPDGFTHLQSLANRYGSQLGVWLSPWGGYGEAREERLKYGSRQQPPFETNVNGFSLSGHNYYERFKNVTENFIKNYDIAIFKFDGIGNISDADSTVNFKDTAGRKIVLHDFEALLRLTKDLRALKPDIYLSITTGTWSSPFWLNYGDITWRSGDDNGQYGSGSERQQWLNYRDKEVYENVVQPAPLYPLNALMTHGICIADNGLPGKFEKDDKNIADEIWSFFGTGTSLQEMYINPHLLSSNDWNCLAKAIKWSRKNADVFPDVHWVGGNPAKAEVYGYAAWRENHGVITLRNPSNKSQTFILDTKNVFDLPSGFNAIYRFRVINEISKKQFSQKGEKITITLQPYEILVMEAQSSR